jgi:hypothetical protein
MSAIKDAPLPSDLPASAPILDDVESGIARVEPTTGSTTPVPSETANDGEGGSGKKKKKKGSKKMAASHDDGELEDFGAVLILRIRQSPEEQPLGRHAMVGLHLRAPLRSLLTLQSRTCTFPRCTGPNDYRDGAAPYRRSV